MMRGIHKDTGRTLKGFLPVKSGTIGGQNDLSIALHDKPLKKQELISAH